MATNKPESRKTHITRVYGTNKKGERLDDIYADMERIDSAESAMQVPPKDQWQALKRKFRWCDDPDKDDYDPKGNPSRKTEVLKVCDPESTEDVNDPDEWIPIRVIKSVNAMGSGTRDQGQATVDKFLNKVVNEELRSGRKVQVRRVVHYDTNIDDLAQKAIDADPDRKEYVVDSQNYTKDIESKDKDQYVEYEIVEKVQHSGNSSKVNGLARQTKLLNDYLIDESEPATQKVRGAGDINPPYRFDFLQNIVNINWGGLAVEFYPVEVSYLTLPSLPNFSKAIIAFWFRVPKETLDAAHDEWVAPTELNPHPLFNGVTPLVVLGDDTVKGYKINSGTNVIGSVASEVWTRDSGDPVGTYHLRTTDSTPGTLSTSTGFYNKGSDIQFEPSFIGIDSNREQIENYDPESGDPAPKPNVLVVKIQMSTKSTASGMVPVRNSMSFSSNQIFYQPGGDLSGPSRSGGAVSTFGPDYLGAFTAGIVGFNPFTTTSGYEDKTSVYTESKTETFTIKLDNKEIAPDRWHLVIFSPDVSGKVQSFGIQMPDKTTSQSEVPDHGSISSTCKAHISLDDVNYNGADIRDKLQFTKYVTDRLSFDPNGIYTPNAIDIALTRTPANGSIDVAGAGILDRTVDSGFSLPTYNYTPRSITTMDFALGIPATKKYEKKIRKVEMAEFQMWTGQTLDTASEDNRRLFVDADGKPVNPRVAMDRLGEPELVLHRSGNWIKGRNTGRDGENRPLTPEGEIKRYKPDPSLHGPQSPKT